MFTYEARLLKVVDGDTVDLQVDLGFDMHFNTRFRLLGINTPELHAKDPEERKRALVAQAFLGGLLATSPVLTVKTEKDKQEKYGRYLATIILADGRSVNEEMLRAGHAAPMKG